jgi:hypothetical protein
MALTRPSRQAASYGDPTENGPVYTNAIEDEDRRPIVGAYPHRLTASRTRSLNSGATAELPFTTLETVAIETPAF